MYDFDYYRETSQIEDLLDDFKEKALKTAFSEIQHEINNLTAENNYLKEENKKLKHNELNVGRKEKELEQKIRNIEEEFYNDTFLNNIKKLCDKKDVWYAMTKYIKQDKCVFCDDNGYIKAIAENGQEISSLCKCRNSIVVKTPCKAEWYGFKVNYKGNKSIKYYGNKPYFAITNNNYHGKLDDNEYCSGEFKLKEEPLELFDDGCKQYHKDKNYDIYISFTTEEECQKYCDWINGGCK